ncbi:sporulation-delaying protein SdpB family protein [Lewinella sp. 4G2]|uniref:sporulation-delaying protein SdpB family protein n=1 Tax=Lewinella sp. 4G2 TaxID=1803372 RepID=UPI0007B4B3C5|nr:sporulation-delaying protein SdpB family protein [Lewinella sp. 4G2]OAV45726.1 hypothetical protein A3850_015040 [Lewinella sp. 4G2]
MIHRIAHQLSNYRPWTNTLGLARTLIALGTLLTMLFSPADVLFHEVANQPTTLSCDGLFGYSLYCVLPFSTQTSIYLSCGVLVWVISGYLPQLSGFFHWWVAASLIFSGTVLEGGDHLAAILCLLLLPVLCLDPRPNHWKKVKASEALGRKARRIAASVFLWLIRLQMAVVYLHAAIGKLAVEEWLNGTAVYYWFTDSSIGMVDWMEPIALPLLLNPFIVALITWGSVCLELTLFAGLFMSNTNKRRLFRWALLFHVAIAAIHGLIGFGLIMIGGLVLYLLPLDQPVSLPKLSQARPGSKHVKTIPA